MSTPETIRSILAAQPFYGDILSGQTDGLCGEFSTRLCIELLERDIPAVIVNNQSHGGSYHLFILALEDGALWIVDPTANQYLKGMPDALVHSFEGIQDFLASNHPYAKPDSHIWDPEYEPMLDLILPSGDLRDMLPAHATLTAQALRAALGEAYLAQPATVRQEIGMLESIAKGHQPGRG